MKRLFRAAPCLSLLLVPPDALAACEQTVARLVSLQGEVEEQEIERQDWQRAGPEEVFCPGDRIRTLDNSRATLQLNNQTFVSLDQKTTVVLSGLRPREPSWLALLKGIIYLRSRTPSSLVVKTHFINAAIEGTEFLVSASDSEAQVAVFEGRIKASNPKGQLNLSDGQAAVAKAGEAPLRKLLVKPRDAVQWALYYPPLIDLEALSRSSGDPAIQSAAARYREGKSLDALQALESAKTPQPITSVALLLGLGRIEEAEKRLDAIPASGPLQAEALALRSIIALARDDKAVALSLANRAVSLQPQSPVAWTALSYAQQAHFDLETALASARKATGFAPDNGLSHTRLAELLASLGHLAEARREADQAVALNPALARAWTVRGFTELGEMDSAKAKTSFREAIRVDSSDPLARFGLGLAKIREGDLEEGTAELEIAASLDPDDSLTRSYLGKAYYEQKRAKIAATEYGIAKQLDPQDPTPWFYDAIKKQTENRPVEALEDMQKAIELNGNRAVYRSKQMLDSDLAARGAAVGRIYNELGFGPRALVEAWQSLAEDPGDYTAHRLLSDAYSSLPRSDLARTSELLQSQLLQPINITPIQPRLAESNLFLVGNLGPSALSLNEFNPLFDRNRSTTLVSGQVGSNDTYANELVHAGLWNNWSYSLGQFHYQTAGFRRNNDIDANIYNAFVQGRVTPGLSVQAEYRHRDADYGFLESHFFPLSNALQSVNDNKRQQVVTDAYRLGFNLAPTEQSKILGSYIHLEQSAPVSINPHVDLSGSPVSGKLSDFFARGNSGEVQHLYTRDRFKSMLGGGFSQININNAGESSRQQQGNGYFYTDFSFPSSVKWTLGGSFDVLDNSSQAKITQAFNPKGGVLWNITPDTVLRAAAFRTTKRFMLSGQTLEPTQVAGFNQLFDDHNETRSTRYGLGLDHRFDSTLTGGVELSERQLESPRADSYRHWRETQYRGYLLWIPHPRWSTTVEYNREDFINLDLARLRGANDTWTQYIPVTLAYFDPSGFSARFKATHYRQEVADSDGNQGYDYAEFLDLGLGYRLPQRFGIVEIQLQNLLNQKYRYEGLFARITPSNLSGGVPPYLPFPPEFTVSARLTLAF
ncbi:MAG: FecR domain-containing protein [Methylococcaceae bacterium]|nr:FecR domain-containing protein [Methylococcaceae bacterium]